MEIIRYFGKSFEIPHIEIDSYVPVGGTNQFSDEADLNVFVDGDGLESLVQEMQETASNYDKAKLKAWLESANIDVDAELFATLYAFTNIYNKHTGFKSDHAKRKEFYLENELPKLSEIIKGQMAECAEIAALAQLYLQEERIDSAYFSGEVIWKKKMEFAEAHSFIPLKFNDNKYIFDPANPYKVSGTDGTEILMPRIQKVESFREKISQEKKTYIETINVIDKTSAWYGTGNGTNVCEKDFV